MTITTHSSWGEIEITNREQICNTVQSGIVGGCGGGEEDEEQEEEEEECSC